MPLSHPNPKLDIIWGQQVSLLTDPYLYTALKYQNTNLNPPNMEVSPHPTPPLGL